VCGEFYVPVTLTPNQGPVLIESDAEWTLEPELLPIIKLRPSHPHSSSTELFRVLTLKKFCVIRTSPCFHPLSHRVFQDALEFLPILCFEGNDRCQGNKSLAYF
jgi:hypothetical protein